MIGGSVSASSGIPAHGVKSARLGCSAPSTHAHCGMALPRTLPQQITHWQSVEICVISQLSVNAPASSCSSGRFCASESLPSRINVNSGTSKDLAVGGKTTSPTRHRIGCSLTYPRVNNGYSSANSVRKRHAADSRRPVSAAAGHSRFPRSSGKFTASRVPAFVEIAKRKGRMESNLTLPASASRTAAATARQYQLQL